MQVNVVHLKREEVYPKRVGYDFDRYCPPRGESLSAMNIQPLNRRARGPIKETGGYQEHPRPEGDVFRDKLRSGWRRRSHERPSDGAVFKAGWLGE